MATAKGWQVFSSSGSRGSSYHDAGAGIGIRVVEPVPLASGSLVGQTPIGAAAATVSNKPSNGPKAPPQERKPSPRCVCRINPIANTSCVVSCSTPFGTIQVHPENGLKAGGEGVK